jgi:hypothetical protein
LGLELVAVALVRGVCRVLHSLPEFRRHQHLVSYLNPRGRRPPLRSLRWPLQSPSHQRRPHARPVETILHLRHPRGFLPLRHRRRRSVRRVLLRLLNHHQRKSLDLVRCL